MYDYWGQLGPYATQPCDSDPRLSTTTLLAFDFDTDVDITDDKTKRSASPDGTGKHDSILIALGRESFGLPRYCEVLGYRSNVFYGVPPENPKRLIFIADWLQGPYIEHFEAFDYSSPFKIEELCSVAPEISALGSPSILLNVRLDLRGAVLNCVKEFITCTFPSSLSHSEQEVCATAFERIQNFFHFNMWQTYHDDPSDLLIVERYWAVDADTPTHVFLLGWYDEESERRFKDPQLPSYVLARGTPSGDSDAWQTEFVASLQAMEAVGMQSSSFHLDMKSCPWKWNTRTQRK